MRFNTFELLVMGSYIYVNKPALTFHVRDHSFLLLNAIFVFKESWILTYFQKWIGNQKRKRSQETLNAKSEVTLNRVKAARGPHSYNLFCAEFFKTGEEKTKIYLFTVKPVYNDPVYSAYSVYYDHWTTSWKLISFSVKWTLYSGHPVYKCSSHLVISQGWLL